MPGNKTTLMSSFVDSEGSPIVKSTSAITILLDEESVLSRLDIVKGFCSAEQEQHLYLVTRSALSLNLHKRLHYHGTNRGSTLAIVALPAWNDDEVWREKVMVKNRSLARPPKSLWAARQQESQATRSGTRCFSQKQTGREGLQTERANKGE